MLRRKRVTAATVALVALLGASTVAIAGDDERPRSDSVEASITFTHAKFKQRVCEGQDGLYVDQRAVVDGISVGDLAGNVTLKVELLFGLDTGFGWQEGTLVIRDPATGRKIVDARFDNADIEEISQGMLVGRARTEGLGDDDGARLFADWRVTFNEDGSITAQIGGVAPDGRLPATVVSGKCTGPFETGEADIPPPGTATTTVSASSSRTRWGAIR